MKGETRRNRLFKKILGEDAYNRVIIATTMWNQVPEREAASRMDQRRNRDDIWGGMVKLGAKVVRHDDNTASATAIIRSLAQFESPVELQLQKELLEVGGRIGLTSAGKQLDEDLGAVISKLRNEIDNLRREGTERSEEMSELRQELEARGNELSVVRESNTRIVVRAIAEALPHVAMALVKNHACVIL